VLVDFLHSLHNVLVLLPVQLQDRLFKRLLVLISDLFLRQQFLVLLGCLLEHQIYFEVNFTL
jgi:hypothetical protein